MLGRKKLLLIQSIYYLATAVWPLLHIDSFMWVTGYKTDFWLVKTVAALTLAIALAFLSDMHHKEPSTAIILLAVSVAIEFLIVDVIYSLTDVISKVYLVDAAVQAGFLALWLAWLRSRRLHSAH